MNFRPPAMLVAILAIVLGACSSGAAPQPSGTPSAGAAAAPETETAALTIFAAASLKNALAEVKTAYEAANPGTILTDSTDSSSALETQIEQGAPADVFLSADTTNPQKLVDAGLAAGEPVNFAGNKLVIIVPADNPAGIATPADLAKDGVKVIAAGDEVPITKYATQLVENLGIAEQYVANVATKEDSVSGIVSKIELGEGDAGIVYVTDATAAENVTTVAIPDGSNVPATYSGVVVGTSQNQEAATAFLAWLAGPDGQAVLSTFGFLPPS